MYVNKITIAKPYQKLASSTQQETWVNIAEKIIYFAEFLYVIFLAYVVVFRY